MSNAAVSYIGRERSVVAVAVAVGIGIIRLSLIADRKKRLAPLAQALKDSEAWDGEGAYHVLREAIEKLLKRSEIYRRPQPLTICDRARLHRRGERCHRCGEVP